jgi:hypothetical protein
MNDNRKDRPMATLSLAESGELHLTLRGTDENRILATVRRWAYWERVDIERDPVDAERCLAVTLVADRAHETIVRDILRRSFGMTFLEEGGVCDISREPPSKSRWSSRSSSRR